MTDPSLVTTLLDAYTTGGAVLTGVAAKYAMLAYRRRRQLAALDTWAEVRGLVAFLTPVALAAWAALEQMAPDAHPVERVALAVVVAFCTALHANTGPLGEIPSDEGQP